MTPRRGESRPLTLRVRLIGGLLILLFLALFSLAVVVFVWQRANLPADYLYATLVLVIAIDLVLLGLVANYRLRVLVVEPVAEMVGGSERIAAGDEQHRLPPSDTAELDRLSMAVNEMADRLIHNQQLLTANVKSLDETNRELSAARTSLARVDKLASIGRLASGIAHEIGNPLGAIMGYAELGRRTGEGQSEWLGGISHEATRIDVIVRGLLDYARPMAAATRDVDVNGVIEQAAELMRVQGRLKNLDMRLDLSDALPWVRADPFQLEQVLVNLLLNASDAVEAEGAGLAVLVAVAHQVPGLGALEDLPGVDATPALLAAGERVVLDLHRLALLDGQAQGLEGFLGLGAGAVDGGELQGPR